MGEAANATKQNASAHPIAICVPARNEAASLPQLFAALERLDRTGTSPTLCLLLDSCRDASAAIARDCAVHASLPIVIEETVQPTANAGHARHGAMLIGQRALNGAGLLLTTDADSTPMSDWLQAMMAGLAAADVVAGTVMRNVTQPNTAQDRLECYYQALYVLRRTLDPVAWEAMMTHHYASAANLGLSADTYRTLGGFQPLASGEDARLIDDASRAGCRVRRDARSVVHTSDRRLGRAAHGLADSLRALDHDGAVIEVAHPRDAAWQYRRHAVARLAFDSGDMPPLAKAIGLTVDHVVGVARDCPNAEAFAMRVVPTPPSGMRRVPLGEAETELATLIDERRAA